MGMFWILGDFGGRHPNYFQRCFNFNSRRLQFCELDTNLRQQLIFVLRLNAFVMFLFDHLIVYIAGNSCTFSDKTCDEFCRICVLSDSNMRK